MNKKKYLFGMLPVIMVSICGACTNAPTANYGIDDSVQHVVENTIHDMNYSYTSNQLSFIVNGSCDYTIVYEKNNNYALNSAKYIRDQISTATGVNIPLRALLDDEIVDSHDKFIVIGSEDNFECADLVKTSKDIGIYGYQLCTKNNSVYLRTVPGGQDGFQLGANKFLELTVGYDLLYGSTIVYDRDGSVIPSMDITERPDFDYRKIDDADTGWRYGGNFTDNQVFMSVPRGDTSGSDQYHTSLNILPPSQYYNAHPKWYMDGFNTATLTIGSSKQVANAQLCYTAHGDAAELALMQQTVANKIIEIADNNPSLNNVTFTIQDNGQECQCAKCASIKSHFSDSIAATIVKFTNGVDDIVQKHYQDLAEENETPVRELYICFFAYHSTEYPPAMKNADGSWSAIVDPDTGNPLMCNEHVCPFIAPISSNFMHSFYDTDYNQESNDKYHGWRVVSKHLYTWIYDTNFGTYMYPYNTFTTMHETLRFIKEMGASMIYVQGQHTTNMRTVFSRLKLYILSKCLVDVNTNVRPLIDKFFKHFYGAGGSCMKQFYEEMISWCLYQEIAFPDEFSGGRCSSSTRYLTKPEHWSEPMLKKWWRLCDQGIEAISYLKTSDVATYEQYRDNILVDSMFPRYAILTNAAFYNNMSEEDLLAARKAFKEDSVRLGVSSYGETNMSMQDVFSVWGL